VINSDILAIGEAAMQRYHAEHNGRTPGEIVRMAAASAQASAMEAHGGLTGYQVIRMAGAEAMRRLEDSRGGRTPAEKIRQAAQHGRLISGEVMAKALTLEPPGEPALLAPDLLPSLAPLPSLTEIARLAGESAVVRKALAGQEIRHQRQQAEAARLAEARRIASQKPRRPIAPYADLSGRISGADVDDFADAVRRARKAGFELHSPRQVVAHGVAHWGLSHEIGAMLTYALADRLQAARDRAAA
jgi:hypothetical protein